MQEAAQAGFAAGLLIQAQGAAQGHHQGADRHRVQVGIFIGQLQAQHAERAIRALQDGTGNFFHHRDAALHVQRLAQPGFAEHGLGRLLGVLAQGFGFHQGGVDVGTGRQFGARLGGRCGFIRPGLGSRFGHIQAALRIDPAVLDAAAMRLPEVGFVLEQELVLPERMVQPGRFEAAEIHPEDQILRFNFFQHFSYIFPAHRGTGWRGIPGPQAVERRGQCGQDCRSLMISYA